MEESGLFDLIKTLGKAEKRYFKKYAGTGSHAVQLFEALEKPEEFDAEIFNKNNRTKKFFKHLASEKQHLLKVLQQSLNEYHRNNNIRSKIHFHLNVFELLFQKRQYKLCEKSLGNAMKLARQYEYINYLPEIYKAFGKLYHNSGNYQKLKEMFLELEREEKEMLTGMERAFKLKMLELKSYYVSRVTGYPRTKGDKQIYKGLLSEMDSLARHPSTLTETLSTLTIKNYYFDSLPDKKPLMRVREEWINTAEKHEEYKQENSMQYLMSLNNLANSYDELDMQPQLRSALEKIKLHKNKNLDEEVRTFMYYYNLALTRLINTGQFQECIRLIPAAENGLKKFERWLHPEYKMNFRYVFAYGYFGAKKYKEALKWTHELIYNYPKETLEEYYNFARIFILLIYFELGHDALLVSELRSAKRYFQKREKLYQLEKTILDFIRSSLKPEGIVVGKNERLEFKDRLARVKKNPYEQQLFSLFDWESWANSKVNSISFEESVRNRVTQP